MIGPYVGQAKYQYNLTLHAHTCHYRSHALSTNSVKGRTDIVIQKVNRTAFWQLSNPFGKNFTKKRAYLHGSHRAQPAAHCTATAAHNRNR